MQPFSFTVTSFAAALVFGTTPALAANAAPGDWPTYMHDNDRSGVSAAQLALPLTLAWSYEARHAPEPAWPPPADRDLYHGMRRHDPRVTYDRAFHVVGVGDRLFFGSSADDAVRCLDAATGAEKWAFFAEGPVRLAPAIDGDRLLFTSDDGSLYCLTAATGALRWKTRLAPGERRIPGNIRIISAWPARTGVLVEDDRAYATAGLFAAGGVHYCVVDAATGKKLSDKKIAQSAQGYMQLRGGQVFTPTGRVPKGAVIDKLTRRGKPTPAAKRPNRGGYPFANIAAGSVQFCGGEGEVAAFDLKTGRKVWTAKVEGRTYSLAVVGERLVVSTSAGRVYAFAAKAGRARIVKPAAPKLPPTPSDAARKRTADAVAGIVKHFPRRKGYCLVLNDRGARLACALAKRTELKIVCAEPDAKQAAATRKMLDAAGLQGRVVVHEVSPKRLPYADYAFNLVVHGGLATGRAFDGPRPALTRVLSPCSGVAVLDLEKPDIVRRGPLPGAGDWTHFYADPANSTCSKDARVSGPTQMQWFGPPGPRRMVDRHNRGVAPLYADGRLFISGGDHIASVDAYNGTVLWERDLPGSMRALALKNCGNMTTAGGRLYVAAKNACLVFDGDSGEVVRKIAVPAAGKDWGYVASVDGFLIGSATRVGASQVRLGQHSWKAAYSPFSPVVCSDTVFACERASGKALWTYTPQKGVIANPSITVGAGRVYVVQSTNPATKQPANGRVTLPALLGQGAELVALDVRTGTPAWRRPLKLAFQHALYASFADGKLVLTGSRVAGPRIAYDLHAYAADTGEPAWKATYSPDGKRDVTGGHGELTQHPVIANGTIYLWTGAYDLSTGKKLKWLWRRPAGGCGTFSSSATALFFRASNPQMTEFATGKHRRLVHETRPGCWINVIPAGGLVLIPEGSSGCSCNYAVQASMALAPVKTEK